MKVKDIMNHRPIAVAPDAALVDVVLMMLRFHLNDLLVAEGGGRLVGIVTYKDIFRLLLPDYGEVVEDTTHWTNPEAIEERLGRVARLPVREVMTTRLHTVSPETAALHAGAIMNAHQVKQLPVVDRGQLVGIVSYTDVTWGLVVKYYRGPRNQTGGRRIG